jgi:16S rRNA (uracil1498-N3)-methyltransferase
VIAEIPAGEGFLIDPRGEARLLPALGAPGLPDARIAVVIGPQAGFSEGEVALARDGGLAVCDLGPAILRTETAAIAAVAVAAAAHGAR